MELKDFQREGVAFLLDTRTGNPHKLLADDMGLGKTIQAIAAWNALPEEKLLVVCPSSVKYNWLAELGDWAQRGVQACVIDSSAQAKTDMKNAATFNVAIVNYELLIRKPVKDFLVAFIGTADTTLVCDEAHKLKSPSAARTKAVLSASGLRRRCSRVWLLTGTPVENRPMELFTILKTLTPERLGAFDDWVAFGKRYCAGYRGQYGWDFTGASNLNELREVLTGFMLHRKKEEVLDQLPQTLEKIITLGVKVQADIHSMEVAAFRNALAMEKVPETAAYVAELIEQGEKVVVFGWHRAPLTLLAQLLEKHKSILMLGGLTSTKKHYRIQEFVRNSARKVVVGQIGSVGQGVDGFQKVCHNVVFLELDWSPGTMQQAIDRCRRMGQLEDVVVHYMLANHPFEYQLRSLLKTKKQIVETVMSQHNMYEEPEPMTLSSKDLLPVLQHLNGLSKALNDLAPKLDMLNTATEEPSAPAVEQAKEATKPAKPTKPKPADKEETPKPKPPAKDAELAITDEVLNDAAREFCGTGPESAANKQIAIELISQYSDGGKVKDVPQAKRAELLAVLKAGPDALELGQAEEPVEEDGF